VTAVQIGMMGNPFAGGATDRQRPARDIAARVGGPLWQSSGKSANAD
jgi:hypothetical protein